MAAVAWVAVQAEEAGPRLAEEGFPITDHWQTHAAVHRQDGHGWACEGWEAGEKPAQPWQAVSGWKLSGMQ